MGTHTYVLMHVSQSTYDEVKQNLIDAGYQHALHDKALMDKGIVLDMHGIALELDPSANVSEQPHKESSPEMSSLAGRILAGGNPMTNEQVQAALTQHVAASSSKVELLAGLNNILGCYFENMLSLAGSVLSQDETPKGDNHAS